MTPPQPRLAQLFVPTQLCRRQHFRLGTEGLMRVRLLRCNLR